MQNSLFKKGLVLGIFILFVGVSLMPIAGSLIIKKQVSTDKETLLILGNTRGNTYYVGGDGPWNYSKIQDAIDDAVDGDTVFVYDDSSPYNENIWINESINLIGENKYTTQINGSGVDGTSVVRIYGDAVTISGFNIENSGIGSITADSGIYVKNSINIKIVNNLITYNHHGITFESNVKFSTVFNNIIINNTKRNIIAGVGKGIYLKTNNNNISHNLMFGSHYNICLAGADNNIIYKNKLIYAKTHSGIWAQFSDNNTIIHNNISNNCNRGIDMYNCSYNNISYNFINDNGEDDGPTQGDDGIVIRVDSHHNVVWGNYISKHWDFGLHIPYECNHNKIICNDFVDNYNVGISIGYYGVYPINDNIFYHNNFMNNSVHVNDTGNGNNSWDNGYPSGGNYWDDYNDKDDYHGPNQDIPGSDGIGDIQYEICGGADSIDEYPLMEPWNIPPYTPNSPNPYNYDTGVSINTHLSWKSGEKYPGDTVTYDIYLGTSNPPPLVKSNHSSTRYDPGQLGISTTYYWKSIAWDIQGVSSEGPIWEFTTNAINNTPPNIPSSPDPSDGEIHVSIENSILEWTGGDPDDDTVTYDVYFGKGIYYHKVVSNCSITNYSLGTLEYNTKYYWKIIAWDEHGDSTIGPKWSFTTVENNPPDTPGDPEPEDGSQDVDINDVILSWSCSDPEGDPITYNVFFEANDPWPDNLVSKNQTGTTFELWTLEYNTTYYWQIVAFDSYGGWATGPVWDFITDVGPNDPPYTPSDPSPENGSIGVDIDAVLSWTGGDPDENDTVVYDVYLEADNPDPNVKVADDLSETWFDPGIEYNTTYYWKIIARDTHYAVNMSSVWHFTTEINLPPDAPSVDGPTRGSPGKYHYYKFTAVDPEEHDVSYYIDWGDGTFDDWTHPYSSGLEVTISHIWDEQGTYIIKAKARDVFDAESDWSEFEVTIPRNRVLYNSIFHWFLERFPMLSRLFSLIN